MALIKWTTKTTLKTEAVEREEGLERIAKVGESFEKAVEQFQELPTVVNLNKILGFALAMMLNTEYTSVIKAQTQSYSSILEATKENKNRVKEEL